MVSVILELFKNVDNSVLKFFSTLFNINSQRKHIRYVMLYCFKKDNSANDTSDELYFIRFIGVVLRLLQLFAISLRDLELFWKMKDRGSRTVTIDTDFIKAILAENLWYSVHKIMDITNILRTTVYNHLIKMKY